MEIMALLVSVVGFLAVAGLVLGVAGRSADQQRDLQDRLGRYASASPGAGFMPTTGEAAAVLKDNRRSKFAQMDRLLAGSSWAERQAVALAQASMPLRVGEYLLIRWLVALLLILVGLSAQLLLPVVVVFGVVGFFLPALYVNHRRAARLRSFDDKLVNSLTMIANALRSGSSFLQAMEMVAREMPSPIAEEFGQTVAEISVGATVEDALAHLAQRVPSYDLYLAVTAITIQREVGGSLAEVLENIAQTIRQRFYIMRDVQAKTAEQRYSAYLLAGLPVFVLILIMVTNPNYMSPMIGRPIGIAVLIMAFVLQGLGFLVMRKLSAIEV